MILRSLRVLGLGCLVCLSPLTLAAATSIGSISGIVLDPVGTPQLGATVLISPEKLFLTSPAKILTNDHGRFSTDSLPAGAYSIKVTLAGFMPAMAQHVHVDAQRTTLLQITLGSVFSSFEKLRRQSEQQSSSDDWTWVLRTSAATRSSLQWQDVQVPSVPEPRTEGDSATDAAAHAQLEFISGGYNPASFANSADSPATAFAYDVGIGSAARLLVAGQMSDQSVYPTGALAAEWLPSGKPGAGPATTIVVRENSLGPNSPVFRGLRISHDDQLALSDRVSMRYGADYIMAGLAGTASGLRPRVQVAVQMSRTWRSLVTVAARPWQGDSGSQDALDATLDALDTFPTIMMRHGHTVLENDIHEEFGVEHQLTKDASLTAAVFHDGSSHTAVMGRSATSAPDFLQSDLSEAFAYDGGASSSTGVRMVYEQNVGENVSAAFIYAYAGALTPIYSSDTARLRDELATQNRHSLAARVSTSVPRLGTKFILNYKWLSGPTVSQQDAYGQAAYLIDPYLSMEIRQPLPRVFAGHIEIAAAAGNLLAQGYVPIATNHGNILLVPAYRYFRGGLSLQF